MEVKTNVAVVVEDNEVGDDIVAMVAITVMDDTIT